MPMTSKILSHPVVWPIVIAVTITCRVDIVSGFVAPSPPLTTISTTTTTTTQSPFTVSPHRQQQGLIKSLPFRRRRLHVITCAAINGKNDDKDDDDETAPNGYDTLINGNSPSNNDDESINDYPSTNNDQTQSPPLNITTISQKAQTFLTLSTPYFRDSIPGRYLFLGMIGLTFLNSGVSVAFSYVGRDFWSALASRDNDEFYKMLTKFSAALIVGAPVSVLYRWQRERVAVSWREWMTERVLTLYYSNRVYYSLERGGGGGGDESDIDNPDQRITEDVRSFTAYSLTLFLTILTSTIDLVSFSLILYSIQPQLFAAIIGYAFFGTISTTLLGKSLVPLNFAKLQREADFRYILVRTRDNAESIAFYEGETIERDAALRRLNRVVENKREIIGTERNLDFFTTAYGYFIQILPVAVVAPQFFAGSVELGVISQSRGAFNHILNDLSIVVNQFESLSAFSAAIDRLGSFLEVMRYCDEERLRTGCGLLDLPEGLNQTLSDLRENGPEDDVVADEPSLLSSTITLIQSPTATTNSIIHSSSSHILSIQNLTLFTPDRQRLLVSDLSLTLPTGNHLLIVGHSGAGKSSLLRAIAGLWNAGSGSIHRPHDEEVYFLPQRPYCVLGTLRDQLLYPQSSSSSSSNDVMSDKELLTVLDDVNLSSLPVRFASEGGLDAVRDWSNTLSLGEQQRLGFARVLVNKPRLVVLDEATSALDLMTENKMYRLLQDMAVDADEIDAGGDGLTYVSVGHRPSLLNYHDVRLRLHNGGIGEEEEGQGYELEDIDMVGREEVVVMNL